MRKKTIAAVLIGLAAAPIQSAAATEIPGHWALLEDDFEGGYDPTWSATPADDPDRQPRWGSGMGHAGSGGLVVPLGADSSYLSRSHIANAEEAYLSFWFHPNGAVLPDEGSWIPGRGFRIAAILGGEHWDTLVALRIRQPDGRPYRAFLTWQEPDGTVYDYEEGEFDLDPGWQRITLGVRAGAFVAVWKGADLMRIVSPVVHSQGEASIAIVGKSWESSQSIPSGEILYDDVLFLVPSIDDLWVDAAAGDDDNDGRTEAAAFRTVGAAARLAGPGTTVHIRPGVYRETVDPTLSGTLGRPVTYRAEAGRGTVAIRGSGPSSSLNWTPVGGGLWAADLSTWGLEQAPRFVVELDDRGEVLRRLPCAREPDWPVETEWKHHEFWWAADGGWSAAGCDPATDADPDCDREWRSMTQLTDRTNDHEPAGIEPGNLTTLGDLAGGTLRAIDTVQGHYVYTRAIVAHDVAAGRITVDRICEHDSNSGNPGLGWGTKYYVEGRPQLLDTPGEWYYDPPTGLLVLWPPSPGDPASMRIEISRRETGFEVGRRSHLTLDGLVIELADGAAVYSGTWQDHSAVANRVRDCSLRYANYGLYLGQDATGAAEFSTRGFVLEDSEIAHIDSQSIFTVYWWEGDSVETFTHPGITDTTIQRCELHHLGFRTDGDNAIGGSFHETDRMRFVDNHVHHVAHNGMQFSRSIIRSPQEWGFSPEEILVGEILVEGNLFERACQLTTDCGCLKFWGSAPDSHVHRDVLVTGNVFRDSFGWSHVSERRRRWTAGEGSRIRGLGAFGLYVDHASGIHAFRNVSYNNAYLGYCVYGVWRDGPIVYVNNISAGSVHGISLGGPAWDTHPCVDTRLLGNIIVGPENFGIALSDADGQFANVRIDHNLYFDCGWSEETWRPGAMLVQVAGDGTYYQTVEEIRAGTPWEDHGQDGDPRFAEFDPADHDPFDGSWPDFRLTPESSLAIDRGVVVLPASLARLLELFGVDDERRGPAFDIGRHEFLPFGVRLAMPASFFRPGDPCSLEAITDNPHQSVTGLPLVVFLDVGTGDYWFWPSWSRYPPAIDSQVVDVPLGSTAHTILPAFAWPAGAGQGWGLRFWGALLTPDATALAGEIGLWEFGYGD